MLKKRKVTGVLRYGIINRWGEFWSNSTFTSEDDAEEYPNRREAELCFDRRKLKIVPVRLTIEPCLSG